MKASKPSSKSPVKRPALGTQRAVSDADITGGVVSGSDSAFKTAVFNHLNSTGPVLKKKGA